MGNLLEVRNLRTEFSTRDGLVKAVNNVSFTLKEGESLGLVGESGCGKSVLSMSIMRMIPQPAGRIVGGEIMFNGRDLLKLSDNEMRKIRGKEISVIFQDPMSSLNPLLTISRHLTEGMRLHLGMDQRAAERRAVELLDMVGIGSAKSRLNDYPHQFSGGMRQRVMIAMAISCNPKLLIADEPTTALDVTIQAQIMELIKNLSTELGMAVILITHDLGVVAGACDRINVMYAGHIIESAIARDLFKDPRHPYALGLLRSVPRVDEGKRQKLLPIEGLPPDLINTGPGCPFAPRCSYRTGICFERNPALELVTPGHGKACWVDVAGGHYARQ